MTTFAYPNQRFTTNLGLSLYGMDEVLADNMNLIDAAYGAGSSINVNGTLVTSPNLSSTLPLAPPGSSLVAFQFDIHGNISAYVTTPAAGGVTSFTGDSVVYNNAASVGAVTLSLIAQAKNTVLAGPATGANAAPTFRALGSSDIPSGTVLWSSLGNAAANLTLANAAFTTTFGQTTPAIWTWANTTASTFSAGGGGPATFVTSGVSTSTVAAVTLNTTGATLIVAVLTATSTPTISDSVGGQSNAWNYLTSATGAGNVTRIAYAYANTGGGALQTGASHVFTPAGGAACLAVYVFSGTLTTAAVFDSANQSSGNASGSPTSFQPGTITPTSGDLVICGFGNNGTVNTCTINSSFTGLLRQTNGANFEIIGGAYLLNAANSALNPTWSGNANATSACVIACFQSAPPGIYTSQSSPVLTIAGTVFASSSIADAWTIQDVVSNAQNGASTLTLAHTGSSGVASVHIPLFDNVPIVSAGELSWNADTGISRLGAASLAIGNGTVGNKTGNLSLNRINLAGADYAGQATVTAGGTTQAVTFAANYTGTGQPVIVLTPTSDPLALGVPVGYWVTYSGGAGAWTGFTVNIQTALAGNVTFNYVVVGVA